MTQTPISTLTWSAPRQEATDFAPEDPLAIDHLQQQLGNLLWPGFTTRTSRAFYYVMVCYGLRVIEDLLLHHHLAPTDDNRRTWFERWEKLWALAICASYDGTIDAADAMRGRNGVLRAWRSRAGRLPLDYQLISRQMELGAMGAYRTSLVEHGLLAAGALRPTPIGADLATAIWGEDDAREELDAYVRECLAPGRTEALDRVGRTTLKSFGLHCRLSIIRQRPALQARMRELLVEGHPPPVSLRVVPEMARLLVAATRADAPGPRAFLGGIVASTWGTPSDEVARNARVALIFGDLASALRACFDRAYRAVLEGGCQASVQDAARAALPDLDTVDHLATCLSAWRATPEAAQILRNEVHGHPFCAAATALDPSQPVEFLEHLLLLHRQVQIARGKSGAWLTRSGDRVLLEATSYRSWSLDGRHWVISYKLATMTELLRDMGYIA